MPYSIVKMDDSYVIRVGDQDFLKVNSRRKAAKLISDVQRLVGEGLAGEGLAAMSEDSAADESMGTSDEADEIRHPAICFQREG